VMVAKW